MKACLELQNFLEENSATVCKDILEKVYRIAVAEPYQFLYVDLRATDPHEMTNLYDDPAHAAMRADLEALIDSRADDMIPLQPQVGLA